MIKKTIFLLLALSLLTPLASATWRGKVRAGDKLYEKSKYDEALVKYLEALGQKGDSTRIVYDLGNVFQGQEKFKEAGQAFQSSFANRDSLVRADALYNFGNALVGDKKYQEAMQAYKSALKLKPGQQDYLHNLELAQKLMKKPPEQQQKQNNKDQKDQNKDQKQDQQQQKDQQKQDEQKQDQQKQDQQKQQQDQAQQKQEEQKQQDQNQQQQQPLQAQQLTKEEAERLLNAIQSNEKRVQENLRRQPVTEGGVAKDW